MVNKKISSLFESSFYDFTNDDILNDKYLKDLIDSESYINEDILYYYIETYNLDEDNSDEILKSLEFKEYVKDYLEQNLEQARDNISAKIDYNDEDIFIFRAITVDKNWLNHLLTQGKRLGIYWSWSLDGAETHWGDYSKPDVATITVRIKEKYINWRETLELNTHPSMYEEKEIRLYKNTPLNIVSILINDDEVDLSTLKNKTFYS